MREGETIPPPKFFKICVFFQDDYSDFEEILYNEDLSQITELHFGLRMEEINNIYTVNEDASSPFFKEKCFIAWEECSQLPSFSEIFLEIDNVNKVRGIIQKQFKTNFESLFKSVHATNLLSSLQTGCDLLDQFETECAFAGDSMIIDAIYEIINEICQKLEVFQSHNLLNCIPPESKYLVITKYDPVLLLKNIASKIFFQSAN